MEITRTVNNFTQFKKVWFEFEIDWLLHKGIKKTDIAANLGMTGAALSNALGRLPSDSFLDRFVKAYKITFVMNKAYEGYGIFYIERGNILNTITYPDCRPMDEEFKYDSFTNFKKAWLKMELDALKEKNVLRKAVAKKLNYTTLALSIHTPRTLSDNFTNKFCEAFSIQFTITKYFNEEFMVVNGQFTLNEQEKPKNPSIKEPSKISKMYMEVAEKNYNLELELKKKDEEIAALKQQIINLKAEHKQ
ncbi:MAG: hypothetical protein IKN94_03920 [Salinivirgaceae bacterium]|nr:hypothetical protein [Salinivirgaceae bacterium]